MPKALDRISKDIYASILWEVPLIFIHLAKIHNAGVYQEKIQCMIKCWGMQIQDAIPYLNTNKLHLATSLGYTNQWFQNPHIDKHIDLLIHAIDFKEIKNEIEFRATNINEGWPFTALILYWANKYITGTSIRPFHFGSIRKSILKENRAEFIKALYLDKEKGMPLSFINGLSGIAVANAIWPEAFS